MSCPYFGVDVRRIPIREIGRSGEATAQVAYCKHKHSPLTEHMARRVIGAAHVLRCEGDLDRCQVPADKLADC